MRGQDRKKYPPSTIRPLLGALNRIYKESKTPFYLTDKSNAAFTELHFTLDRVASDLHREGIGVEKKTASVKSIEHEGGFAGI